MTRQIYMAIIALFTASSIASAQVVCSKIGKNAYCQDGRHDTVIVPLTPHSGAILRDGEIDPYVVLGDPSRQPRRAIEPLEELPTLDRYDRYDTHPSRDPYDRLLLPGDDLPGLGW